MFKSWGLNLQPLINEGKVALIDKISICKSMEDLVVAEQNINLFSTGDNFLPFLKSTSDEKL